MTDQTVETKVSEEDLRKQIEDLEGKKPEAQAAPTVVEIAPLAKNAAHVVAEGASPQLKGQIDANPLLKEIVSLLGAHVDTALSALQKSVATAAQNDLSFLNVLGDLKKSVDAVAGKVEEFGKQPTAGAEHRPVTVTPEQVLEKQAGSSTNDAEQDPVKAKATARKTTLEGLDIMLKSLGDKPNPDQNQLNQLAHKIVVFESTGQIDEQTLAKAVKAYNTQFETA